MSDAIRNGAVLTTVKPLVGGGHDVLLSVESVSKSYGSTQALTDVTVELRNGEVLALAGENGAGKSTVLNVLTGVVRPDDGRISLRGAELRLSNATEALRQGLFRWFQHPVIVPDMPAYENIFLGFHAMFRRCGVLNRTRMRAAAAEAADEILGDGDLVKRPVRSLPYTTLEMLQLVRLEALIRLLETASPVLLLDEPTAALSTEQTELMFRRLDRLLATGASAIYVSHRMEELARFGTRGYVLKDGRVAGEVDRDELGRPEVLHTMMVGRDLQSDYYLEAERPSRVDAEPALTARGVALTADSAPIDLVARRGEILGIAGVEGSGKESLARILAGIEPPSRGQLVAGAKSINATGARSFLDAGVALLPVDRHREGAILSHSIADNIRLGSLHKRGRSRTVSKQAIGDLMTKLAIKAPGSDARVEELSGGNQQKVVIAKWLAAGIGVLVAENPTQGVDIGARHDCYRAFREFVAEGGTIVLVSDDTPELLGLSDRCLVLRDLELAGEVDLSGADDVNDREARLVRLMVQ